MFAAQPSDAARPLHCGFPCNQDNGIQQEVVVENSKDQASTVNTRVAPGSIPTTSVRDRYCPSNCGIIRNKGMLPCVKSAQLPCAMVYRRTKLASPAMGSTHF